MAPPLHTLAVSSKSYRVANAINDLLVQRPDLWQPLFGEQSMHLITVNSDNYVLMQQIADVLEGHSARMAPEVAALQAQVAQLKEDLRAEEKANAELAKEVIRLQEEARRATL